MWSDIPLFEAMACFLYGIKPPVRILSSLSIKLYPSYSANPSKNILKFRQVIFKYIWVTGGASIYHKIALSWMSLDLTNRKSTLIQAVTCCYQATSQCLGNNDLNIYRHITWPGHNGSSLTWQAERMITTYNIVLFSRQRFQHKYVLFHVNEVDNEHYNDIRNDIKQIK